MPTSEEQKKQDYLKDCLEYYRQMKDKKKSADIALESAALGLADTLLAMKDGK